MPAGIVYFTMVYDTSRIAKNICCVYFLLLSEIFRMVLPVIVELKILLIYFLKMVCRIPEDL